MVDQIVLLAVALLGLGWCIHGRSLVPLLLVGTAITIYADAWTNGIRKRPGVSSFVNLSPLGWTVAVVGLPVVAIPTYLAVRGKLRMRSGPPSILAAAIAFVVLLVTAVVFVIVTTMIENAHAMEAARAERERRRNALYVPCMGKILTELPKATAPTDFTCPVGRVSVEATDKRILLVFHPADQSGAPAARLAMYVSTVLPNLGPPNISRAAPCRGVLPLALDPMDSFNDKLAHAALTYKMANGIVRSYERMGGLRYAEWHLAHAVVSVEDFTNDVKGDEGPSAIFRITTDPNAPGEAEKRLGNDVPWNDATICDRREAPHLASLRTKLLADGWWFDDAEAFMAAAMAVGRQDTPDTADEVFYVARMLIETTDDWDEVQRALLARDCMAPAIKAASKGVVAAYDTVASIDKGFNWIIAPAAPPGDGSLFVDPAGAALEVRRFDSMVHTPVHAKCVLDHLREPQQATNVVQVFGLDQFLRAEKVPPATWKRTWALATRQRFARELYVNLARARAALVIHEANPNVAAQPSPATSMSSAIVSDHQGQPPGASSSAIAIAAPVASAAPPGPRDQATIDRLVRDLTSMATTCARRDTRGNMVVTTIVNPSGSVAVAGVALGDPSAPTGKIKQCVRWAFSHKSITPFTGDPWLADIDVPQLPTLAPSSTAP